MPYPTYFAEQLASKIIQAGGQVVQATSSDPNLSTYASSNPTATSTCWSSTRAPTGP